MEGVRLARRPTLRDVAAHAGVSFKTVSRVVNGEPGVSPELAERVRLAVEELAFRPNAGARILRSSSRTASIAVLLDDIANPFSALVARSVQNVAMARGVMVFAASLDEDEAREQALVREFGARQADGLIIAPSGDDQSYLSGELGAGTAIVCVDREARNLDVDSVITTNRLGAQEAVRHLAAAGHRRIAFLGDRSTIITARHRHQGYRAALAELGVPVDPRLEMHDLTDISAADGATSALLTSADPPTALFTAQNLITLGALNALRRHAAERRVALVGFDDLMLADMLDPGITVIAQDPAAIGRIAAERLFARLAGDRGPGAVTLVPTTLIRRGSGEIPPH